MWRLKSDAAGDDVPGLAGAIGVGAGACSGDFNRRNEGRLNRPCVRLAPVIGVDEELVPLGAGDASRARIDRADVFGELGGAIGVAGASCGIGRTADVGELGARTLACWRSSSRSMRAVRGRPSRRSRSQSVWDARRFTISRLPSESGSDSPPPLPRPPTLSLSVLVRRGLSTGESGGERASGLRERGVRLCGDGDEDDSGRTSDCERSTWVLLAEW
jgi:hypothetical protein